MRNGDTRGHPPERESIDVQCYCKVGASPRGDDGAGDPDTPRKDVAMRKVVRCSCGVEIRAEDERVLIARVQQHAREAHDLTLTDEQVLAMAEIDD
jgi:predicted small metal-binding protein